MVDPAGLEAELKRFRRPISNRWDFSLGPIRAALAELGDPQDAIPPAIHVTGTNGKGSTIAFIRAMAEAAGLKVHVFTSPHLLHVNERIRLAGRLVEDEALRDTLQRVADCESQLSYFEALTAAAFILFSETRADLSIIEVGAGGATDATNVMRQPAACVVTAISRDHEAMFSISGVAAIARLKAGIFRDRVPAVLAEQPAIASGVLREEARVVGAEVVEAKKDWRAKWEGQAFSYSGKRLKVRAPWLGLRGRHQAQNAGAACAALEARGDPRITEEAMAVGLREAVWPARLQRLKDGPLTRGFEGEIWIDAAHNPGGAGALAEAIKAARPEGGDHVSLVLACQAAKDVEGVLGELLPAVDDMIACPLPDSGGQEGGPGAEPEHIAQIARSLGAHAMTAGSFLDAVALAKAGGADRVFIAGSVYLCGAALRSNAERVE